MLSHRRQPCCFSSKVSPWGAIRDVIDKAKPFERVKYVEKFTAREAAKQDSCAVAIVNAQRRRSVAPALTVTRTWAANKPTIAIPSPPEPDPNAISAHCDIRDTRNGMTLP